MRVAGSGRLPLSTHMVGAYTGEVMEVRKAVNQPKKSKMELQNPAAQSSSGTDAEQQHAQNSSGSVHAVGAQAAAQGAAAAAGAAVGVEQSAAGRAAEQKGASAWQEEVGAAMRQWLMLACQAGGDGNGSSMAKMGAKRAYGYCHSAACRRLGGGAHCLLFFAGFCDVGLLAAHRLCCRQFPQTPQHVWHPNSQLCC